MNGGVVEPSLLTNDKTKEVRRQQKARLGRFLCAKCGRVFVTTNICLTGSLGREEENASSPLVSLFGNTQSKTSCRALSTLQNILAKSLFVGIDPVGKSAYFCIRFLLNNYMITLFTYKKSRVVRLFACTLLAFCSSLGAWAIDHVKVVDANGAATYFKLAEKPVVSFSATSLVLTTTQGTVEYPIADYRSFEFADPTDGINPAETTFGTPIFSFGETLSGEQLQPGTPVVVYDSKGRIVGQQNADAQGRVAIALGNTAGIFIVKTATKSFKFIKK